MSIFSIIHRIDETCFEIDITLYLRKLGIGGIKYYKDRMEVGFIYFDCGITAYYPSDLNLEDKLLVKLLESELLRWEGRDGERFLDVMIESVCKHVEDNLEEITESIERL